MPTGRSPRAVRVVIAGLVALDLVLLVVAWRQGAQEIRDSESSVTTGYNVLWSILATFVGAAAWNAWRIPRALKREAQIFALAAIAAHGLGHLARFYYLWRPYDDVLHSLITAFAAFLALRHAQTLSLFPSRHSTPLRAALLTVILALAVAGAWEIFEFAMDRIQDTREQDDLADTMQDMIAGLVGGALAALWAYAHPRSRGRPRAA